MTTALTWQQVSAWRLQKHSLLHRVPRSESLSVVEQICGLHAQMMSAAELQVWARVEGTKPEDTRNAIWTDRSLVKTWAMRGTLHLVPAREYGLFVVALSIRENWLSAPWLKYFNTTVARMEALIEAIGQALDGRCLTRNELTEEVVLITGDSRYREQLSSGWGSLLKPAAARGVLCFGPSQGQAVTFVRPDQWIGPWKEMDREIALKEIVRRYLTVYGPATLDDFARWVGVPPKYARPIFKSLGSELQEVSVDGLKGFALASTLDLMRAASDISTVRLLPNFDLFINLNYPHRRFMIDEAFTERVYRKSAWVSPVVLVNGRMQGVWSYEKKRGRTVVFVEFFNSGGAAVKKAIDEEAQRLGEFFGSPAEVVYAV